MSQSKTSEQAWKQAAQAQAQENTGSITSGFVQVTPQPSYNGIYGHDAPCPNCGYCKHCGRRNETPPTYPPTPATWVTTTGLSDPSFTIKAYTNGDATVEVEDKPYICRR